jgi:N-acetyl-1-D-myo-inositol-2-amino-2-deoxy-alpha-D-glucopyranoside deacetylase
VTREAPTLFAIFAHPDDETFRPGGTLALLARWGAKVHVLTLTHGEAGSWGEPALCTLDELPGVREHELRCACAALGIEPPHLLSYPDGGLTDADPERVCADILAVARQVHPQALLSFGPDGLSGHPDHIMVGQWAAEIFHGTEGISALYTVAVPQSLAARLGMKQVHPVPDEMIALSVDVSSVWEKKLAALHCHATQWSLSPMRSAPSEQQRLFFGQEHFVRAAVRSSADDFLPQVLQGYLR